MFGENTNLVVMMRMEQLREETEHAQLVRIALEARRANAPAGMKRRTTTLPGLVLHWWAMLTQQRNMAQGQLPTQM